MDTSALSIAFDKEGICNYCSDFLLKSSSLLNEEKTSKDLRLTSLLDRVRFNGRGKRYDCIVGVSGGVDSSWALVKAVQNGLRPLAVHMDNGWNSELAQNNIANLVTGLGVDLFTYVIDWTEYRGLMQAFFDSDVIDIELLYDNAMTAVCYQQARKYGLRYILAGSNQATEGMQVPSEWNWYKYDAKNIRSIVKRYRRLPIKTFPLYSTLDFIFDTKLRSICWTPFLDYFHFIKEDAICELESGYGFRRYPYKHYESVFTRFYQAYLLPEKFCVDKRLVHLSTLIISDQLSRDQALEFLKCSPYPSAQELDVDLKYFLKKMGWDANLLGEYISRPRVEHDAYPSEYGFAKKLSSINRLLSRLVGGFPR